MKALIVVLLISGLHSLTHARQDSCITSADDDHDSPYQDNLTLEEGESIDCRIVFEWDDNHGCVVKDYVSYSNIGNTDHHHVAFCGMTTRDSSAWLQCRCFETNCNTFEAAYEPLMKFASEWPVGSLSDLANCLIRKISRDVVPTTSTTSTVSATQQSSNLPDTSMASTNTTVATNPSSLDRKDEKSLSFLGLFIGSAVFNVLMVVTILVLVIVIIKMKKGGGAKQGSAKTEQKVPPTATVVQIENPVEIKKSSEVLPSTENKADQAEAAADSTTLNTATDGLDTTESSTISDSSTGQYGAGQVQITVRGFQKE